MMSILFISDQQQMILKATRLKIETHLALPLT